VSAFGDDDLARIDAWLQEQVNRAQYPSLSVAIVRDGTMVYQAAFGFENLEAARPATAETAYHVASVTKVFTASLAVMLDARGVVDLDDPVVKYLPEEVVISTEPAVGATITLRQLASHTSGLPRAVMERVQSARGRYKLEPARLYDQIAHVTLKFDPGTGNQYSNLGFGLLGHALERAAGKPLHRLLQEMIADPLRLKKTAIRTGNNLRVATGYATELRLVQKPAYRRQLAGSDGLVTSARDLAKFLAAQMQPGLFSKRMLARLHTAARLADGSRADRALGWSFEPGGSAPLILSKDGRRSNCSAWIGFAPKHGVGVAVLANCGEPLVDPIGEWLLERAVPDGHKPLTDA
jgi:CubicO group peptidase (beta-lactamase class C family)